MDSPLNQRRRKVLFLLLALAVPAGLVVLYTFPPTEQSYYPRCAWHWLTRTHCPGCGTARALHALLHGDPFQAAAYNLLVLLFLPLAVFEAARYTVAVWTGRPYRGFRPRPWLLYTIFAVLLAYFVLRNIPLYPFTLLAPHELGAAQP